MMFECGSPGQATVRSFAASVPGTPCFCRDDRKNTPDKKKNKGMWKE